jgi:uncharacterized membrane protein YqiK
MAGLVPILIVVAILAIVLFGVFVLVARFYRQVDQGRALIVNTMRAEPLVTFTGAVVYPIINRAEHMDMSVKIIEIDRRGKEGLICKDNIRADINVNFFVRVNKTQEDVLKVAQSIGCARASDPKALRELFTAKFSEALKTVGKHFDFADLYKMREEFKDQIIKVIGKDLNGFILDDAAIDFLEQTPLSSLDRDNIMDAEGIKKITDLTVVQNVATNELRQKERMEMGSQNLTADEAVFRFEQRRAEAEAKKEREIAVAKSREQNEALRISNEEAKRTELARLKNEEETLVATEIKSRGQGVAQKNRERELAVETERVEKERQMAVIAREREVALGMIAKEKEVEVQKKEIADVVRTRVAVDKTVAAEEEQIKDVRTIAQANREKETVRIGAEAAALEQLVKQVKAAEASEEAAKFKARERTVTADAELDTADKLARAKIRLAEGIQAEEAAKGLADARVREAQAIAFEKQGLIEARVTQEKLQAEAIGKEKQGLADVRVKEADAVAVQKRGTAEAGALRERMIAEATGLAEKASSMKALDEASRGHEEFRLSLEKDKSIALEEIHTRKDIAASQAQVLSRAFEHAKFNIVGGDGAFFDRFVKAVSVGQSVEAAVDQSSHIKALLAQIAGNGGDGGQLSLSGLLERMMSTADPASKAKLQSLLVQSKKLGIDDHHETPQSP